MDALRQRWHDVAAPKLHKARWFLALWVVLALVAIPWGVRAEERGLEAASAAALADAGVVVDDVAFTGRNAVVFGSLTDEDRGKAADALSEVEGIRNIDWQITPAVQPPPVTTPPVTTTTTMPPPDNPAVLEVSVNRGRISLAGQLPDAHVIASLASAAEMGYGADVVNWLSIGDVVDPGWLDGADQLVSSLGLVSKAELMLDGDGITGTAVVPADSAAGTLDALLRSVGADAVSVDITVSDGDPAVLSIVDDGTLLTVEGALYRKALVDSMNELLAAIHDGEVVGQVELDKSVVPAFALTRLDNLVVLLAAGEQWSLAYENEVVSAERLGKGLFLRDPAKPPTATGLRLLDEVATMLVGDPRLHLTIEVGSAVRGDGSTDEAAAQRRADAITDALMRMGVDPARVTATGVDEGEVLRFWLEPAER